MPDEPGKLTELSECLYLHDNQSSRLLDSLGNLTRLRYLNVDENSVADPPKSLACRPRLRQIGLRSNASASCRIGSP